MTKQEFLAISLPFHLKVLVDTSHWFEKREPFIAELEGVFNFESYTVKYLDKSGASYTDNGMRFKPILHQLSDLTKEIEHNGEKFVPMYELANMQGFSVGNIKDWKFDFYDGKHGVASATNGDWMLRYMVDEESFFLSGLKNWNKKHQKSRKQLSMFQKLIEWKFNLMDESEQFINVNELDINPYK